MATMNISLPDSLREFVESEVQQGGYSTASEYFRELVRRAQERRAEQDLERKLLAGLDSGAAQPMTKQDWAEIRQQVRKKIERRGR